MTIFPFIPAISVEKAEKTLYNKPLLIKVITVLEGDLNI